MATWTTPITWATGAPLTSAQMNAYVSDNLSFIKSQVETNAQTDSYTLVLADAGKVVEVNKASGATITVPTNASVAFPVGATITVLQVGAGQITIAGAGGVTVNSAGSRLKTTQQWSAATLIKRATDTWVAFGDLAA
jgi:hypothetical protein